MLYIGSDHGGFQLKATLIEYLQSKDISIEDCGTYSCDSVDYPDNAEAVCEKVMENPENLGILICGTGVGISMAANKVTGIRAALCSNEVMARLTKQHNNANILCMGERIIGAELAKSITDAFLEASFEGGRHQRRIDKVMNLSK